MTGPTQPYRWKTRWPWSPRGGRRTTQLSASRAQLAAKNWRLILPDGKSTIRETPNVLVYGNVSAELLTEVAQVADEQTAKLAKFFKQPADAPLVKGRLTLYVFDKRYDYGEVGTMLEHREIPSAWQGHWRSTGVDAYGCLLITGDRVPAGLVAQQIAGAYIAGLGTIPRWFAEGTARAVAAKADAKDPRIKLWDDQVSRIVQAADKPEAFLSGDLPSEACDILSYSFARLLMNSAHALCGAHCRVAARPGFRRGLCQELWRQSDANGRRLEDASREARAVGSR